MHRITRSTKSPQPLTQYRQWYEIVMFHYSSAKKKTKTKRNDDEKLVAGLLNFICYRCISYVTLRSNTCAWLCTWAKQKTFRRPHARARAYTHNVAHVLINRLPNEFGNPVLTWITEIAKIYLLYNYN